MLSECGREGSLRGCPGLCDGRVARGAGSLACERREYGAQRVDQLLARDVALAELDAQAEGFVFRLKIKDERLRPGSRDFFVAALAARLVAGESALNDAHQRFGHL